MDVDRERDGEREKERVRTRERERDTHVRAHTRTQTHTHADRDFLDNRGTRTLSRRHFNALSLARLRKSRRNVHFENLRGMRAVRLLTIARTIK